MVDGSNGHGMVEQGQQQFSHAAVGAVADQQQSQDELLEPGLGDSNGEPDVLVALCSNRVEGLLQGQASRVELLVDELAADVVFLGGITDRAGAGQDTHSDLLALPRTELLRRPDRRSCHRMGWFAHVCFLLNWVRTNPAYGGNRRFLLPLGILSL